jgi:hypothetical protein
MIRELVIACLAPRRQSVGFASVALAALLAGCTEAPGPPAKREVVHAFRDLAASPSCPAPDAELVLDPHSRVALDADAALPSLAALNPDTILAIDPESHRLVSFEAGRRRALEVAPREELALLAGGGGHLLAASDAAVYRLDPRRPGLDRVASLRRIDGRIAGVAYDGETLWVSTARDTAASLLFIRSGENSAAGRVTGRVRLPGPAHLQSPARGLVVASLVNPPHSLFFFDAAGREVHRAAPPALRAPGADTTRNSVFTLATLPLDCGAVLQVLADLRSQRRWFALYRLGPGGARLARLREVDQPLGFVQSLPGRKLLVGSRDQGGRREIVLFRWYWKTPSQP